jgi:hypothetical protein
MLQDVHVKLNLGLSRKKQYSETGRLFAQAHRTKFKNETIKVLHLEHSTVHAKIWTLQKVDQKYLERLEMWCWRRMEK